jgi:hypothetical protein
MTARPAFRQRKSDRLITPGATKTEIECDFACGPFDAAVRALDIKWGVDRLPELVSPETARKYGSAMAKLNAALDANDPDEAVARVNVLLKGLRAMDAEAEAANAPKANPAVIEGDVDGFKFSILLDGAAWPALKAIRPDLNPVTLRQVGNALRAYQSAESLPSVQAVKDHFPGATITKITPRKKQTPDDLDDEIPW